VGVARDEERSEAGAVLLVGVLLAAVVLVVVRFWWAEGYIGASEAIVLFAVFGGLLFGLFASQNELARWLTLIPLAGAALWSLYLLKAGSLRSYYRQKARQYEAAVDADPSNVAARTKLAEALYEIGDAKRAIAEMQIAVELNPQYAVSERRALQRWQEEERLRETGNVLCYRCGQENRRGSRLCAKCGTELRYYRTVGQALKDNIHVFATVSAAVALAAISFAIMPGRWALLPIGCGLLAALGWVLLRHR